MNDEAYNQTATLPAAEDTAVRDDSSWHKEQGIPADLKSRTARGTLVSFVCQALSFVLRTGSMVVLARLLVPEEFGLVGMVTAATGFLTLFKEAGLSNAAVQTATITHEQHSMLFWINVAIGCALATICAIGAPGLAAFYGEPRLLWITVAAGTSFIFNGVATQHRALLLRNMRIPEVGIIELISLALSVTVSIVMAVAGFGYWALVSSIVIVPAGNALGVWLATRWIPAKPSRGASVRHMLRYGGTVTLNSIVVYLAYNIDKVLLGRFWGASVLGIYGRAYSLIDLPTNSLHSTIGLAAFPALSRLQDDPVRLKSFFLRIYNLFLTITIPITTGCALFADDIIRVALGPQWHDAAIVFRLLAPTIIAFAIINPLGFLMFATGRVVRSLKIAFLIAPVVILGYVLGLRYGSVGVATGFSSAMVVLIVPVVYWARHGTLIGAADITGALMQPVVSIIVAGTAATLTMPWTRAISIPLLRLSSSSAILFGVYAFMLLIVFKQKAVYRQLFRQAGLKQL